MTIEVDKSRLRDYDRRLREERIRRRLDVARQAPNVVGRDTDVAGQFKNLSNMLEENQNAESGGTSKFLQAMQPVFSFLEKVTLPFEATSSAIQGGFETAINEAPGIKQAYAGLDTGVRALFGLDPRKEGAPVGLIPGLDVTHEGREKSIDALRLLFSGEINGAEAAGLLREANRTRRTAEQIVGGILFDPTTWFSPLAIVKTGVGASALKLTKINKTPIKLSSLPERASVLPIKSGEFLLPVAGASDALPPKLTGARQLSDFTPDLYRGMTSGELSAWLGFGKAKLGKQLTFSTDPAELAARHGIIAEFDASRLIGRVRTGKKFDGRWANGIGDFTVATGDFPVREALRKVEIAGKTAKLGKFRKNMDELVANSTEWQKLVDDADGSVTYIKQALKALDLNDPDALNIITETGNRLRNFADTTQVFKALGAIDTTIQQLGARMASKTKSVAGQEVKLLNVDVAGDARMKAIMTIMRHTAVRPTDAVNMSFQELDELAQNIISDGTSSFWLPRIKRFKGKATGGETPYTREVTITDYRGVRAAIDEFIKTRPSLTGSRAKPKGTDLVFGWKNADPEKNVTEFRDALSVLRTETGLPLPLPAEMRPLVAQEWAAQGLGIDDLQQRLGHGSPQVTIKSYMRDYGTDIAKEYNAASVMAAVLPAGVAATKVADARAFKGAKPGRGNTAALVRWGDDILHNIQVGPQTITTEDSLAIVAGKASLGLTRRLAINAKLDNTERRLLEEAYQLDEMQDLIVRMREARDVADIKVNSINTKAFPGFKAMQDRYKTQQSDLADVSRQLERYTRRKVTQIASEAGAHGTFTGDIERVLRTMRFGRLAEGLIQEAKGAGIAIGTAKLAKTLARIVGTKPELAAFETTAESSVDAAKSIKAWLNDSAVRGILESKGLYHNSATREIEKALRKSARTAPDMFGDDFRGLDEAAKIARIKLTVSAMTENRSLIEKLSQKKGASRRGGDEDTLPSAGGAGGDEPPIKFQRDVPDPDQPFHDQFGFDPSDVGRVTDVRTRANNVQASESLKAKSQAIRRYSNFIGEGFERTIEWVGGGYAPFTDRLAQIALGVRDSYSTAKIEGEQISSRIFSVFKQSGIQIGQYNWPGAASAGGKAGGKGNEFIMSAPGFSVKKTHPGLQETLADIPKWEGKIEERMKDLNFIFDLPVSQWDEFYQFDNPKVRNALLYVVHNIDAAEKLAVDAGLDMDNLLDARDAFRLNAYVPRVSIGAGGARRTFKPQGLVVEQARTSFFKKRGHLYYSEALKAEENYLPVSESVGLYIQSIHQLIAEKQGRKLLASAGAFTPQSLGRQVNSGKALLRYGKAKVNGKLYPEMADDEALAQRWDASARLLQQVQDNPTPEFMEKITKFADDITEAQLDTKLPNSGGPEAEWLKGFIFTDKDRQQLKRVTEQAQSGLAKVANLTQGVNQIARVLKAGLDVGAPLIFGLPLLGRPSTTKIWAQAYKAHFAALFKPESHRLWRASDNVLTTMREASEHGVIFGRPEPFEALGRVGGASIGGRSLTELPFGVGNAIERAESAFTMFQEYSRVSLWDAMAPQIAKRGEDLSDLGAVINKMTGTYNQSLSGVTPTMSMIQSSLLMFAPVYRRASYGLLMDVGRGKMRRREALKALGGMFTALGAFAGVSHIVNSIQDGKDPFDISEARFGPLDPRSPEFLTVRVPGSEINVGIGAAYYSLIRMLTNVVVDSVDPERREKLVSLSPRDQPLLRWMRGQTSPMTGLSIDYITGRTYLGDPLRDDNEAKAIYNHVVQGTSQFMPFWFTVEGFLPSFPSDAIQGFGEFSGARAFPNHIQDKIHRVQIFELKNSVNPEVSEWREQELARGRKLNWRNLPVLLQQQLTSSSDQLTELQEVAKENDLNRGDALDKRFIEFREASAQNRQMIDMLLAQAGAAFERGDITPRDFNKRVREANGSLGQLTQRTQVDFSDVIGILEERRRELDFPPEDVGVMGDWAFDKYMETISGDLFHDDLGNFDVKLWRAFEQKFRLDVGEDTWDYVQRRLKSRRNMAPIVTELDVAKETLSPYWGLQDSLFTKDMADSVSAYLGMDNFDKEVARATVPGLRLSLRRLDRARQQFRVTNPEIDWLLVKFYDASPRTPFARQKQAEWKDHQRRAQLDGSINESLQLLTRLNPIGG